MPFVRELVAMFVIVFAYSLLCASAISFYKFFSFCLPRRFLQSHVVRPYPCSRSFLASFGKQVIQSCPWLQSRQYYSHVPKRIYAPINSKLQHPPPPPGKPRAFELLKIGSFKLPPPRAKMVFKCPTLSSDLSVKCPS